MKIKKGEQKNLQIDLKLQSLFRFFNPNQLESAEYINEDGNKKIIISETHNTDIYYSLVNRFKNTIHVIVK